MFPAEKPAMLNTIVRGIMGKPTVKQGESFVKLLEGPELEKIMQTAWRKMWENLVAFGHISAGLIGIIMLIRAIKLDVDTIIHGYALHTVYVWSLFLLGAIWDSVTGLLLHLKNASIQVPLKEAEIQYASIQAPLKEAQSVEIHIEQEQVNEDEEGIVEQANEIGNNRAVQTIGGAINRQNLGLVQS